MKTFLQILFFIAIAFSVQAQVVTTTNPSLVVQQSGTSVTVTFDVSAMSGLAGYAGPLYVHTGVSTSAGDWQHTNTTWPTGGTSSTNIPKYQLTQAGTNKWTLTISPDINTYYGIANGEVVTKLCFVVRSTSGTPQSKPDIFIPVYQPGLNVAFTTPANHNQLINKGASIAFSATASESTTLKLYIDNTQLGTTVTGTSISQSYTFSNAGSFWAIAEAGTAPNTVRDSVFVNVKKDVEIAARPALPDGINIVNNNTVTFILYAPNKTDVFVVGDFNKWRPGNDYMMKKDTDGNRWWLTVNNLQPNVEYSFQYLVDGNLFVGDAYAQKVLDSWNDKYIPSSTYPNLKLYPAGKDNSDGMVSVFQTNEAPYNWEVTNFQSPSPDKLVIYELLLRDFTNNGSLMGDLNGAMTKLDYLQKLGINAIELMPTQEFDGNESWGYSPCYYFAMDKAYGTKDMYKKFIDECHKRGIAVILDIVYNQATGQHPFAKLYWDSANNRPAANNPWFNAVAPHPYSVFCDFNHESPLTREFFKRNLKFLLEEYKFDGFRFDLTKGFTQTSSTEATASNYDASRIAILKDYQSQIKATKPNAYMIIEHFATDSEERELSNAGMLPWGNANSVYCQSIMGYQNNPTSSFSVVSGWTRSWSTNNLVGYMESHDEERTVYKAKTFGATTDIKNNLGVQMDRAALNAAFFLPIPGAKMIWQFGELGYDISIDAGGDRTGRKPVLWNYYDVPERRALNTIYMKLNALRGLYGDDAFSNKSLWSMQIAESDWAAGRRICLNSPNLKMVILGNFNPSGTATTNPNFPATGTWYNLLTGEAMNVTNTNMTIPLDAGKFIIFTDRKLNLPSEINEVKKEQISLQQTPDNLTIVSENPVTFAKLYTINGLLIKQIQGENTISIANLPKGCYILNVQLNGENFSRKFIK